MLLSSLPIQGDAAISLEEMVPGLDGAKMVFGQEGRKILFWYELHNKVNVGYCLIRAIETTTASVHDRQIDRP